MAARETSWSPRTAPSCTWGAWRCGGAAARRPIAGLAVQETVAGVPAALLNGPAFNVACMYAQFARDIQEGTQVCPNFEEAVAHHRVLDMIEQAALQKRSLAAPDRAPAHSDAT